MKKPEFLAFAGLDERTDLDLACAIADQYPVEWGFLASFDRAGEDSRYPSFNFINKMKAHSGIRAAIHLCGSMARRFNAGELVPYLRIFDRIQVNLRSEEYDEFQLDDWANLLDKAIITQVRGEFPEPRGELRHFLFDQSGGRGIIPDTLPEPEDPGILVGYAGGITPENVLDFNAKVPPAVKRYYLDMESGIRTDGWLDLRKCIAVCEAIYSDKYGLFEE